MGRSGAKVVITCDAVYRGTKLVPLYETMVRRREAGRQEGHGCRRKGGNTPGGRAGTLQAD